MEEEAALILTGDLKLKGNEPNLTVNGTMEANSIVIGNHGKLIVAGNLDTNNLTLSAYSKAYATAGSLFGGSAGMMSLTALRLGSESLFSLDESVFSLSVVDFYMDSGSEFILEQMPKHFSIDATSFTMLDGAKLNFSAGGMLDENDTLPLFAGASYGGEGGSNNGTTYGSESAPTHYGSGTSSSRGGGIVLLTVTDTAQIDGDILADGEKGGASGGSIKIQADIIKGHGKITANGGSSDTNSGGGGGRIAILAPSVSLFYGTITAYGGAGIPEAGAAGTIYKKYTQSGGVEVRTITVNNNDQNTTAVTYIHSTYALSVLNLFGSSNVKSSIVEETTVIDNILGDFSGTLYVLPGQTMDLATQYGTTSPYLLTCRLIVEEGALANLPPRLQISNGGGDTSGLYNLELYGNMSKVQYLTVSAGGRMMIHSQSRSSLTGSSLTPVGTLSLRSITVATDGKLEISPDSIEPYTIDVLTDILVKYGGEIVGRNLLVQSQSLEVAFGGVVSVDYGNLNAGSAAGVNNSGGSYGGSGGSSEDGMEPSVQYIGDIRAADKLGSMGGSGASGIAGLGGGLLRVDVPTITIHGEIRADGQDGTEESGGGSGGSVEVNTENLSGTGVISVKGGAATQGGGGGGGRIFIGSSSFTYQGTYTLCGGSSIHEQAGGSGTAFVQYRDTQTQAIVYNLFIDNSCASSLTAKAETYIDLPGESFYDIDNLDIGDDTLVSLITENLHLKVDSLACGTGSLITIGNYSIFSADVGYTYSAITCSFHLKEEGEIRLPNSVELKGEASQLEGNTWKIPYCELFYPFPNKPLFLHVCSKVFLGHCGERRNLSQQAIFHFPTAFVPCQRTFHHFCQIFVKFICNFFKFGKI